MMAMKTKASKKRRRICKHDDGKHDESLMFRCACGNVWMGGEFQGSVPPDQSAVSIFGAFSRGPAQRG